MEKGIRCGGMKEKAEGKVGGRIEQKRRHGLKVKGRMKEDRMFVGGKEELGK